MHRVGFKNVGVPNTPQEIKRLRREVMDMCRRDGQPVIWKHRFNQVELEKGEFVLKLASARNQTIPLKQCPACYDPAYDQVRNDCPVCFSVSIVSVEDDPNDQWINDQGRIVTGDPGTGVRAPLYGGYGPSVMTWIVEPDVTEATFTINEQGVFIQKETAQGNAPWYPAMGDTDLITNIEILGGNSYSVIEDEFRYELKEVTPISIRGWGNRASGKQHNVGQIFEIARLPKKNIIYKVPVD